MRSLNKLLLSLLTVIPVATISTTAYSKLNEMAGEEQNDLLQSQVRTAKRLIFSDGAASTTVEDAKARISEQTGITDENDLNDELQKQVQVLQENGLIETNESVLRAASPSAW